MSVLDVAGGTVTKIHDSLPQPGAPTWSPDGTRVALAGVAPLSTRFREGTNQILTISDHRRRRMRGTCRSPMLWNRHARRRRAGVVARRHQDGRDLRRDAVGVAGVERRRAARSAAQA